MTDKLQPLDQLRAANAWLGRISQPFVPWVIVGALCVGGVAMFNGMVPLDSPLLVPRQFVQEFAFHADERPASCLGMAVDALPVTEQGPKKEACALAREQLLNEREMLIQATRTTNAAEDDLRQSWQQTLVAFLQAILTVLALVFTGWAAFAASKASRAAERSVRQAEKAANIQLRAYLHVQSIEVIWSADNRPAFDIVCANTGQTPAKWFELSVWAVSRATGAGVPEVPGAHRFSRWPVPVGGGSERSARVLPEGAEDLDLRVHFAAGGSAIFALGKLRYEDVFGIVHTEEFSAFKRAPLGRSQRMAFATGDVPAGAEPDR